MTTSRGAPYSAVTGLWKSIKDALMVAVATAGALVVTNGLGIADQCPEAVITIGAVVIPLKVIMQFMNNYRKNA